MEASSVHGAEVRWTGIAEGDLSPHKQSAPQGALLRLWSQIPNGYAKGVVDRECSWLIQVHGSEVREVTRPTECAGIEGDAMVTRSNNTALAIFTADCAPIALVSPEGVLGVVHAGWRGLVSGVLESALARMRELGARKVDGLLGPCIHPECYPFSDSELSPISERFGNAVRSESKDGNLAFDLPAAVRIALAAGGVDLVHQVPACTACSAEYYSHRGSGDAQRQAMIAWMR